jgi:asparagine synthase (glutamine-hydrolysing)
MSAIGGVYCFEGYNQDSAELLTVIGKSLAARGPDGGSEIYADSLGMTYRAFHTNRQSWSEQQPMISSRGQIMAWDGRLDNREDLRTRIRDIQGHQPDVAIVMSAYLKWGIDFLSTLIGDFALALWEPNTKVLLLARDPVGPRPLFYHVDNTRLIWSTELESFFRIPGVQLEVDDDYVAGYLAGLPEPWQTPYKNISAVPPGNFVIARDGQLEVHRFWGLNPNNEIRYKNDGEYEEHFRDLFREAVSARLQVDGPVWAELSGGLDSSSIVCMADRIIESGEVSATRLETVSAIFDESPSSDERRFIRYVEEKRGRSGHHLSESEFGILAAPSPEYFTSIPNGLESFAQYHKGVRKAMLEDGARVLLCGVGGDEMLTASPNPSLELADLITGFKPLQLHRRLQLWSQALKRSYLSLLWQNAVVPTLPRRIQVTCRNKQSAQALALLNSDFVKRMNLRDRLQGPADIFGFPSPSGQGQASAFLSVVKNISAGYHRAWGNVEIGYPFMHRPLVEFLQAIPVDQGLRPGETRSLMRRALRDLLPIEIVERTGKGNPSEALFRAVARESSRLREMFSDSSVCVRGYVNRNALMTALELARHGANLRSLAIIRVCCLEVWLRALESKGCISEKNKAQLDVKTDPNEIPINTAPMTVPYA